MRTMTLIRALGPVDTRSIARDSMLRWILVLTPVFALAFRFGLPPITGWLDRRFGFDLVPYYPLVMSSLAGIAPGFVGAVIGFLLLDQRDDETLPALLVTPMSLGDYVGYRLAVPIVVSTVLTTLMFPLAGVLDYTFAQVVLTSVCAAPLAALNALVIGSFANNKVQGLAVAKVLGILAPPAIAAWFVPMPWQVGIGIIPQYWPMKVFWLFEEGSAWAWAFAAAGIAYQGFLLWLLARRFARVVRR